VELTLPKIGLVEAQRRSPLPSRVSDHHRQESSHADFLALCQSLVLCGEERFEAAKTSPRPTHALLPVTDFDPFFTVEHLNSVFDSLIDSHFDLIAWRPRISTGADRIELDLFQRQRHLHLAALSRKVLEGRFTFSPFLEREIPKADSKDPRTISIGSIRDCIVQRALYDYLYPTIDTRLSPSVFGYRKGRSAHNAVRQIRRHFAEGRAFLFDADLRKFFDSVDHDVLQTMVDELAVDARAKTLMRRFIKTGRIPSAQVEQHRATKGKQRKYAAEPRTIGVPQGGILSGLLTNLYLSRFDAAIVERYEGFIRYADDFLVCCRSPEECRHVHEIVTDQLVPLKVALHPDKTKECVEAVDGVDFLGFHISIRGVQIRRRNVSKFKARIRHVVETQKVFRVPERTLRSLARRINFKIRGPDETQLKKMADRGKPVVACRRSWIGFFRIVDDLEQIRGLDRWLRRQVSQFMWRKHRCRATLREMQRVGMRSLVNSLWKARSAGPGRGLETHKVGKEKS
jgi:RNA-directed DNA polymerase